MGQVFFSVSVGMGIYITYASYIKENEIDIARSMGHVICLDTLVSLAAVEGAVRLFLGLEDSAETGDNAKNNHFISK